MTIRIDWGRAEEVFGILLARLKNREFPYDTYLPPHAPENLPASLPRGGVEHARYLFISCLYMRGRLNSDVAFRGLRRVYENVPEVFGLEWLRGEGYGHCVAHLESVLRVHKHAYGIDEGTRFWVANLRKLDRHWQGDPRRLYREATNYQEMCDFCIGRKTKKDGSSPFGFLGFRYKMTSMLAHFLVDSGLVERHILFPVPVDFHIMRFLTANDLLVNSDRNGESEIILNVEQLSRAARELSMWYCERSGADPVDLCDAIWHLSRWGCRYNMGNKSSSGRYRATETEVRPTGRWTERQVILYKNKCWVCPVKGTCEWNVPSANTYNHGVIVLRGKRPSPPQLLLF